MPKIGTELRSKFFPRRNTNPFYTATKTSGWGIYKYVCPNFERLKHSRSKCEHLLRMCYPMAEVQGLREHHVMHGPRSFVTVPSIPLWGNDENISLRAYLPPCHSISSGQSLLIRPPHHFYIFALQIKFLLCEIWWTYSEHSRKYCFNPKSECLFLLIYCWKSVSIIARL